MNIMLTNDDGINGIGILKLAKRLKQKGNVYLIAPMQEKSASSHSITIDKEIKLEKRYLKDLELDAYVLDGSPVDCIKLGLQEIFKDKEIDLIVSGMNKGANLASDIIYSGTVSAAMEGIMQSIPSIAISYDSHDESDLELETSWEYIDWTINKYLSENEKNIMLNLNIPNLKDEKIKGVKMCRLGKRIYSNAFEKKEDEKGRISYKIKGKAIDINEDEQTDTKAIKDGFISITPLSFNLKSENERFIERWLKK